MKLNKLSLKDRRLFIKMLSLTTRELSVYTFENIYIWHRLFDICWAKIEDNLCLFFKDKIGCFLYLPPLGERIKPEVILESFKIMDKFNKNQAVSRIENVEAKDSLFYRRLGYKSVFKSYDYLCQRASLVELRGDSFKSKRACINYFTKNYKSQYLEFIPEYSGDCVNLYRKWMKDRQIQNKDPIYRGMLLDNLSCLQILLNDYKNLNLVGRLIKVDNQVKGFSFGFQLNKDTFCILFEIADLSFKGLSQYIFRQFCAEVKKYKYINIMDDLGLENLKTVKMSYRPVKLIPSYIITRKDE
jgi:hypothetical protein